MGQNFIRQESHVRRHKVGYSLAGLGLLGLVGSAGYFISQERVRFPFEVTAEYLAPILSNKLDEAAQVPAELPVPKYRNLTEVDRATLHSTLDPKYSEVLQKYLKRFKPDYGAAAVINADTGALLALESYVKEGNENEFGHLAVNAPFPAASVAKIITATAAIDQGKAYAETVIPFNGRSTTLYKRNVLKHKDTRWTRRVTLRKAFARSVNSVFGKVGLFKAGGNELLNYAEQMKFNEEIAADISIAPSQFQLDPTNEWDTVESASGFTNRTLLSPVHGAMMASAILNDGVMKSPYVVDSLIGEDGNTLYLGQSLEERKVMEVFTARQMQSLMEETVKRGTSRKQFRTFRRRMPDVVAGGKTGSLDGDNIRGRTDWFVGYASDNELNLAIGVVTVHVKYWTVKSSYLASLLFEEVYREKARLTATMKSKQSLKDARASR